MTDGILGERWGNMNFEKYDLGTPKNAACLAVNDMMKNRDTGKSYADMIRFRLGGSAFPECRDTYYVAHEDGHAVARLWNGWGNHADAIGNWGNFFTEEAYRGRGLGGKLLALWQEDISSRTDLPLCFLCTAGSKALTDLYGRFGFRPAIANADRGPLYMPIGDQPASFQDFCASYYKPTEKLIHKRATIGYRHEIDCLLRFAFANFALPFGIGEMPSIEMALLYAPERAGILFSEDGHAVGWSMDGIMQMHPTYSGVKIEMM